MKPIPILILTAFLLFFTTNAFVFAQNPPDSTESKGNISAESKQNTEGGLGVSFIHEDYAAAMSKAKADGKMVFLDAYTTWCGPCKLMAKKTFTDDSVADFFNARFVNLKLDMEKGDGPDVLKRYNISAFPTLLFLSADGEIVHKALGFHDPEQFLALGKAALSNDQTFASWNARYEKGERTAPFLKEYAEKLAEAYDDRRAKVAEEYLATQTDWATPTNLDFIYRHTEGVESNKLFDYLVAHQKAFETKFTRDEVSLKIQGLANDFLFMEKNLPTLERADSLMKRIYPTDFKHKSLGYRLSFYRMKGDREAYATAAVKYFRKYDDSVEELSDAATTFLEQIEDTKMLSKAIDWAKRAAKKEKSLSNQMTVAQLYGKLKKNDKARKAAEKAIEIAKMTGENYTQAEAFLKML